MGTTNVQNRIEDVFPEHTFGWDGYMKLVTGHSDIPCLKRKPYTFMSALVTDNEGKTENWFFAVSSDEPAFAYAKVSDKVRNKFVGCDEEVYPSATEIFTEGASWSLMFLGWTEATLDLESDDLRDLVETIECIMEEDGWTIPLSVIEIHGEFFIKTLIGNEIANETEGSYERMDSWLWGLLFAIRSKSN